MSTRIFLAVIFLFFHSLLPAQKPMDEEKIKKAVELMRKMTADPSNMLSIYPQLEALKLSAAENKEAEKRLQQEMMSQAGFSKEQQNKVSSGKMSAQEVDAMKKQVTDQKAAELAAQTGTSKDAIMTRMKYANLQVMPLDKQRIAALPKSAPSDASVKSMMSSYQNNVLNKLPEGDKYTAEQVYKELKAAGKSSTEIGNIANALWMEGLNFTALILMSRVCQDDLTNANNLNNYAAYLVMYGEEEMALPILMNLRKKFPKSDAVTNNIAQAWFGLGDLQMAKKYIDTTRRIFPKHVQANNTSSVIAESEGDKGKAVQDGVVSLQGGYADSKMERLKRLGYLPDKKDIPVHVPQDPLYLNKYQLPDFPKTTMEYDKLQEVWKKHKAECEEMIGNLQVKKQQLSKQNYQKGFAIVAASKYEMLSRLYDSDGWMEKVIQYEAELYGFRDSIRRSLIKKYDPEMEKLDEKYRNYCGEGQKCPQQEICEAYRKVMDKYVEEVNSIWSSWINTYLNTYRKAIENQAYLSQYSSTSYEFEQRKLDEKIHYLTRLANISIIEPYRQLPFRNACSGGSKESSGGKLQDYDDVNCKHGDTLQLIWTTIITKCSKMTTSFKIDGAMLGIPALKNVKLEIGFTENLNTKDPSILPTDIIAGTIEVGVKVGSKDIQVGPTGDDKLGVKVEAGIIIELDQHGISDYGVKGSVGAGGSVSSVGGATPGKGGSSSSVVGAEARWTVNSGPSVKGKGVIKDAIKFKDQK